MVDSFTPWFRTDTRNQVLDLLDFSSLIQLFYLSTKISSLMKDLEKYPIIWNKALDTYLHASVEFGRPENPTKMHIQKLFTNLHGWETSVLEESVFTFPDGIRGFLPLANQTLFLFPSNRYWEHHDLYDPDKGVKYYLFQKGKISGRLSPASR